MDKDEIYLQEIKEFCRKIIEFTSGLNFQDFSQDEKLQLAVVKLIENIGEASKRLSENTRSRFLKIDWKNAMAMRDKLAHDYMEVDLAIVFDAAIHEVPILLKGLSQK